MRKTFPLLLIASALSACGTSPLSDDSSGGSGFVIGDGGSSGSDADSLDGGAGADASSDAGGLDSGDRDAPIGLDVEPIDPRDTGSDDVISIDAGPADTGSPEDTGAVCVPGFSRCDGALLLVCGDSGTFVRRRCDEGTTCAATSEGSASCVPDDVIVEPICEPLALRCGPGGATLQQCTEDGIAWLDVEECPFGCDSAVAECLDDGDPIDPPIEPPIEACENPDIRPRAAGEFRIDLCDFDDTTALVPNGACGEQAGEGSDYTFSFTVERPSVVVLEALDGDPNIAVDTVVAIRTACDDEESQIACHDGLPCLESSEFSTRTCTGDRQPRHARITTTLEAGVFYGVVDHFEYTRNRVDFDCGITTVRLSIRPVD